MEQIRSARVGRPRRLWACRSAMLSWLYDRGAVGSHSQSVTWDLFDADGRCRYYGEPFKTDERTAAAAWLQRNGLIDGYNAPEIDGPFQSFVTDAGERCAGPRR